MKGTIRRVVEDRRFGFIRGEDNQEYFFHADSCEFNFNSLVQELRYKSIVNVEFNDTTGPKGLRAENVSYA